MAPSCCQAPPRRKAALIGRDIAFYSPNEAPSPRSYPATPPINDPASLVGAPYVIEGATLGGRMIAARLAKSINARPAAGADFFNVYGDQVDLRWRAKLGRLTWQGQLISVSLAAH